MACPNHEHGLHLCPALTLARRLDPSQKKDFLNLADTLERRPIDDCDNQRPGFEDVNEFLSTDERCYFEGTFFEFKRKIIKLEKELRRFAYAIGQFGSSVSILSSAFLLRERISQILLTFQVNAAANNLTFSIPRENLDEHSKRKGTHDEFRTTPSNRPVDNEKLDPQVFADQLDLLARDIMTFLSCLNELAEYSDENINASIVSFERDLKYWASYHKKFSGHYPHLNCQEYIRGCSTEIGDHIDNIVLTLAKFIEVGIPSIRLAQKHGATNLLNLSTIVTFSAVIATTMQLSINLKHNSLSDTVNGLWFASLALSIGAAVNNLLGLACKQAIFRSPHHRIPWWILIWIKRSPFVFLVMSVACFSIGLCCFAYASQQASVTSLLTTILSALSVLGLAAILAWFISEKLKDVRNHINKRLEIVLTQSYDGVSRISSALSYFRVVNRVFRNLIRLLFSSEKNKSSSSDPESVIINDNDKLDPTIFPGLKDSLPISLKSLQQPSSANEVIQNELLNDVVRNASTVTDRYSPSENHTISRDWERSDQLSVFKIKDASTLAIQTSEHHIPVDGQSQTISLPNTLVRSSRFPTQVPVIETKSSMQIKPIHISYHSNHRLHDPRISVVSVSDIKPNENDLLQRQITGDNNTREGETSIESVAKRELGRATGEERRGVKRRSRQPWSTQCAVQDTADASKEFISRNTGITLSSPIDSSTKQDSSLLLPTTTEVPYQAEATTIHQEQAILHIKQSINNHYTARLIQAFDFQFRKLKNNHQLPQTLDFQKLCEDVITRISTGHIDGTEKTSLDNDINEGYLAYTNASYAFHAHVDALDEFLAQVILLKASTKIGCDQTSGSLESSQERGHSCVGIICVARQRY